MNEKWSFNFELVIRQKMSAKNLYSAGGGWVDGGQKGPLISPNFEYVNNWFMKIQKKSKKVCHQLSYRFENLR